MADTIARALASQAKNLALGTTNGETVDARTGADTVARATLGAFVRELHQKTIDHDAQIVNPAANTTATLQHGLNVVSPLNASILTPNISGRTLVNLLGRDGNFERDTVTDGVGDGWTYPNAPGSPALDTANVKYGLKSQRITSKTGDLNNSRYLEKITNVETGKYYVALVDVTTDGTAVASFVLASNTGTIPFSVTTNSAVNKTHYLKLTPSVSGTIFVRMYNNITAGQVGSVWFDGVRLYEITQAEYNLIDVDPNYTGDKLADKYPYVDDVKHVVNPMVTKQGKNLLPPFTEWNTNASLSVNSPYNVTLTGQSGVNLYTNYYVPVLPNTQYSLSISNPNGGNVKFQYFDTNKVFLSQAAGSGTTAGNITITGTTPSNCGYILVELTNNLAATIFTFTNPQLELGSTATAFEAQNIDYVYGASDSAGKPLTLAASLDGTVKDSLYYRDGKWLKEKRWVTDVVLDGAVTWIPDIDETGLKRFRSVAQTNVYFNGLYANTKITKFDGKILSGTDAANVVDSGFIHSSTSSIYLRVADTDTGWGETYSPSAAEIANFMNGWKMSDSAFAAYSTGTKYWTAVDSPKADFAGKVSGSTAENANIGKYSGASSLLAPSAQTTEFSQSWYNNGSVLDGTIFGNTQTSSGAIGQMLFSFNLIEHVLRKYGSAVFGAAVTTVDRVTWLKANVGKVLCNWWGYGSGPAGFKGKVGIWSANIGTPAWLTSDGGWFASNNTGSIAKCSMVTAVGLSNSVANVVDANGFVHFLAYADAAGTMANPTVAPTLSASGSGSGLGAGTFFVAYTWTAASGETMLSPEASVTITAGQNIVVTAPALPIGATGIGVYISTTTGTETKQGTSASNTYTQTAALVTGALASSNTAIAPSTINTDFVELEVNLLVQTLPTGYATTSWTPYKLSYQLATTTEEAVNVEGAINLHTGGNQIEVSEGVIVREKVTPFYYAAGLSYFINDESFPMTLKNKDDKILAIYKNGVLDKKWSIRPGGGSQPWGRQKASLAQADYDATAEYTVTYTMLDKYANTAAAKDVTGDYQTTTKMILDHVVRRLADDETQLTVNIAAIAQLYKRVKALGG